MQLTFVYVPGFVARWNKLKLTDADLQELEKLATKLPDAGAVISGAGGLRKIRFAPSSMHSGKSGALRVLYLYIKVDSTVYFMSLFAKSDKANLTAAEKAYFKSVADLLTAYHKKKD